MKDLLGIVTTVCLVVLIVYMTILAFDAEIESQQMKEEAYKEYVYIQRLLNQK